MIIAMENAPEILRRLYARYKKTQRGGYKSLAKAMGRGDGSSIQRYFKDDWSNKRHFPSELVADFERVFVGNGEPKITKEEVWKMATPHPVSLPREKDDETPPIQEVGALWRLYKDASEEIQEEFDALHAAFLKKKSSGAQKKAS